MNDEIEEVKSVLHQIVDGAITGIVISILVFSIIVLIRVAIRFGYLI